MANNVRIGTQVTGVGKASSELDNLRDKFDRLQKQGAKGFAIGAGAAITAKGLSILDSALSSTLDVMGDATQAAIEEEQSLAKLDAALRANVAGWDGNSDAIEKVLASRMKLGFADDEQRSSLALLVGATKDYNKALAIQRTAMDLARLKGIDLKAASEALVKVEGGQFRILKSLGIELKANATQTEALAAVQAVAEGQAQAYADTSGGKLLASQVKVGEAMERIGEKVLPAVVEGTEALAGAVEGVVGFIDLLNGKLPDTEEGYRDITDTLNSLNPMTWLWGRALDQVEDSGLRATRRVYELDGSLKDAEGSLDGATDAAYDARKAAEDLEKALDDLTDAAYDSAEAFGDQKFSADELKGKLAELSDELDEARGELEKLEAIKDPTKAQRRDIEITRGKVAGLEHDFFDTRVELAKLDKASLDALMKELASAQYKAGKLGDSARAALAVFQKLSFANKNAPGFRGDPGFTPRAGGGPVAPNKAYIVGEKGPEVFVPNSGGNIVPNGGGGSRMPSGGGAPSVMVPVTVIGQLTPAQTLALGQQLAGAIGSELRARGLGGF